jgi:hypothetical protein
MAKSEHLHLKSGPRAKAIPRHCQNGHPRRSWYEETEEAQLSMYQPNPDFREPLMVRYTRCSSNTSSVLRRAAGWLSWISPSYRTRRCTTPGLQTAALFDAVVAVFPAVLDPPVASQKHAFPQKCQKSWRLKRG